MSTKPCITCGKTITKGYTEGRKRWDAHKYCSNSCRTPWNKGLDKSDSRVLNNLRNSTFSQFGSVDTTGEKNNKWKGKDASYAAKHMWIRYHYGPAIGCINQRCKGESFTYHWSNISGEYKRERSDWQQLCVQCHKNYDLGKLKLER